MDEQRLQKVLAAAGVASRRKCEELIADGVVKVNGKVVDRLPFFVDVSRDAITVEGRKVRPVRKRHYLLNKPKGVVCTNKDSLGRKKAIDIIGGRERIFCVGRLDIDSTGAIILTNDTELVNRLTHPRYELPKTYVVKVKGRVSGEAVESLKKGVWLAEGKTRKASVKVLKRSGGESMLKITICQGLNRQIRRMTAKVGYKVVSLKRTQIGKLNLRGLGVGKFRELTKAEVVYLIKATDKSDRQTVSSR